MTFWAGFWAGSIFGSLLIAGALMLAGFNNRTPVHVGDDEQ